MTYNMKFGLKMESVGNPLAKSCMMLHLSVLTQ